MLASTDIRSRLKAKWGYLAVFGALAVVVIGTAGSEARPNTDIALTDGTAWLLTGPTREAVLAAEGSGEVLARVAVGLDDATLVQAGSDALIHDPGSGTLAVIRGDVLTLEPIEVPRVGRQAFLAGRGGQHRLVDPADGTVFAIDVTARTASPVAKLGPIDRGGAVDGRGTLWLTRSTTGQVIGLDRAFRQTEHLVTEPGTPLAIAGGETAQLIAMGGRGPETRQLGWPDVGTAQRRCPPADPADPIAALSLDGLELAVVSGDTVTLTASGCVQHARSSAADGASTTANGAGTRANGASTAASVAAVRDLVAIANPDDRRVLLLDPLDGTKLTEVEVTPVSGELELFVKHGVIWFNDTKSAFAGTLGRNGVRSSVQKFTPTTDGTGSGSTGSGSITDGAEGPAFADAASAIATPSGADGRPALAADLMPQVEGALLPVPVDQTPTTSIPAAGPSDETSLSPTTLPLTPPRAGADASPGGLTVLEGRPGAPERVDPAPPSPEPSTASTTSTTTPPPIASDPSTASGNANVLESAGPVRTGENTAAENTAAENTAADDGAASEPSTGSPPGGDGTPISFDDEASPPPVIPRATPGERPVITTVPTGAELTPQSPEIDTAEAADDLAVTARIRGPANPEVPVGQPVTFEDVSSGSPSERLWDFADGTTSAEVSVDHRWATPGVYRVTLTVGNEVATHQTALNIFVVDPGLDARFETAFTFDRSIVEVGEPVEFVDRTIGHPDRWVWDFGDGTTAVDAITDHSWSEPGSYRVVLRTEGVGRTAAGGAGTVRMVDEAWTDILVRETRDAPHAAFDFVPTTIFVDDQIFFASRSTGSPTSFVWDLGDGTRAIGESVSHHYHEPGRYRVRLTVENSRGSDIVEREVLVQARSSAPTARLLASTLRGTVDTPIDFASTASADSDHHRWDWGDGSTSTGRQATKVWDRPGTYQVSLTVENEQGTAQTGLAVVIEPAFDPIQLAIDGDLAPTTWTTNVGSELRFEAVGGANPSAWHWDFGDGTSAMQPSPTKHFDAPGLYRTVLTVVDEAEGGTAVVLITVTEPAPQPAPSEPDPDLDDHEEEPSPAAPPTGPSADSVPGIVVNRPDPAFAPILPRVGDPVEFTDRANPAQAVTTWRFADFEVVAGAGESSITVVFERAGVHRVEITACSPDGAPGCATRVLDILVVGR